ncbi:MAG: hypothetical protein HY021_02270 [Burkholderiales bacterium]|nr:hypothetical protein [Burkholderiales bacterium]
MAISLIGLLAGVAIVTQDNIALRAGPRDSAPQQAVLWQGDALEVRGEKQDYLQVWDHRRERAGYVRASQVRQSALRPADAPELLAVLRFVRDTPGAEALGIAYAAAYLQAAPADKIDAEPFDAIGTMADRLARRAAFRLGNPTNLAAHLEVAAHYGVRISGQAQMEAQLLPCYDGEAFRRVLALPSSTPEQRARAALGLSRHDCVSTDLTPAQRLAIDQWRAQVLDAISAEQFARLADTLKNRLQLRRAGVWAELAFEQARRNELAIASTSAQRALRSLAAVNKAELTDDDRNDYTEAAIRVGASRWAAEAVPATIAARGLRIAVEAGQPGESCVMLLDDRHDTAHALARRCTYGLVWAASARADAQGKALALAVQPLAGWREAWVFHRIGNSDWAIDVLPPAAGAPELGYVEFAGWVPASDKLLLVRESKVDGRLKRSFEVARLDTLLPEKSASAPELLSLFTRWQDAAWKRQTVSLR